MKIAICALIVFLTLIALMKIGVTEMKNVLITFVIKALINVTNIVMKNYKNVTNVKPTQNAMTMFFVTVKKLVTTAFA